MHILITDRNFQGEPLLERETAGKGAEIEIFDAPDQVTDAAWARADAVVTYRGTRVVTANMAKLQRCRIIVRGGVGYDGLDLSGLGARGIAVCTVPDYGTTEVADHAIALLLTLRRGIASYHDGLRADPQVNWRYRLPPVVDRMRGATFGVVGLGRIGTAAARRAQAFDMKVQFFDPHVPDGTDLATGWRRVKTLAELFETSNAVSVHTPLNDETRGLIDADCFARMPENAILVNTSRGAVVDVDALYDALKARRPAAAALDVLPVEPADKAHPLVQAYAAREAWLEGRLILTPHAAFYTEPGLLDMRSKAVGTIASYLRDGVLRNCVNGAYLAR